MSTFSQYDYSQKKIKLSALRFEAKVRRLQARKMRIDSIIMRMRARIIHEKTQNLIARAQEWNIK